MAFQPFTYRQKEYGLRDFRDAQKAYEKTSAKYGDLITSAIDTTKSGLEKTEALTEQFEPGGGYGRGRRKAARETIYGGVARDTATGVAAGMSSMASARGLNVLAGREIAKFDADIEDERARLQLQSFTPYTQMISSLSNLTSSAVQLETARPNYASSVRLGTPEITGVRQLRRRA